MKKSDLIMNDIATYGLACLGKKELVKHLEGERLSPREMIIAKCYDCMGYYSDGRGQDCEMKLCPLYPLMPYKAGEKYKSKNISEETRLKMSALARARFAK